jgi:SNF2 family DNA or RNA helicase
MIVLHAFWEIDKGLHLWAESSEVLSGTARGGKNIRQKDDHPFILSHNSLKKLLVSLSENLDMSTAVAGKLAVLLPSSDDGPIPSEECLGTGINDHIGAGHRVKLAAWQIDTFTLNSSSTLEFLIALESRPPRGIGFGSSLRFWTEISKLSLELVARESYLPAIRKEDQNGGQSFNAAWEVMIEGKDGERIKLLVDSMPPCCRAIRYPEGKSPSAAALIYNFLNLTIDNFLHNTLAAEVHWPPHPKRKKTASLAEEWLKVLSSPGNQLNESISELVNFSQELDSWLSRVKIIPAEAPLRTSFRLEPSENGHHEWHLSFHLQASEDRSLIIPAEKVWRTRSGVITFLKHRFENPQERLLADLGKASGIFPPIEESLKTACPVGVKLNTESAYQFLRQYAYLLEQSGFGVFLPAWWQKPALRLGARLKLKPRTGAEGPGSGLLGLNSIVAYEWEIALGDTVLSREEFKKLARLKVPLIKIRGQWVELKPDEIEKALAFFNKGAAGEMKLGEGIRAGLGQEILEAGVPVIDVGAEGWIKDFLDTFSRGVDRMPAIESPAGFQGHLRPYQVTGISWMAFLRQFGLGACLADDMGLGKTIEFISLLLYLQEKNQLEGPSLLVCPMSVVNNWKREAERFAPSLRILVHHGSGRDMGDTLVQKAKKQDIVITTYSLAHRDAQYLSRIDWECLALDEAQNIKNPSSKQSQAMRKLNSRFRVALTGTPVENRLSELWSIMEFLNPGYLKSAQDFHTRFVTPIEKYRSLTHTERLKHLIQPFVLRRVKTDKNIISDLPDKIETKVFCNLTGEQATLYEAIVKEMLEKIKNSEGMERKGLVLSTLLKLKQVCNHPAQFLQDRSVLPGRSGKLLRLEEMLEEILAEGDKALIFAQFAEMGKMLKQQLQETYTCEALFLHGGTPRKERDAMIERFQNDHRGPSLFILSLKAGGLGLNLTAANHVFHYDRWWNPAVENQATDRAFRIGQKKNVQVHKFVCLGTMEERIDEMIEQKKELARNIVGTGEAWLTEMSTEQLKEVLKLSREAVEV